MKKKEDGDFHRLIFVFLVLISDFCSSNVASLRTIQRYNYTLNPLRLVLDEVRGKQTVRFLRSANRYKH